MPFRLWDRIRDWVILSILLLGSVVMMLSQNDPMFRGMRSASLEITSGVEARFAWVGQFFRAIDENTVLTDGRARTQLSASWARTGLANVVMSSNEVAPR